MSDLVNDQLILEAQELITSGDLDSTGLDKVMEQNIADNDLEALWAHLVEARNLLRED